MEKRVDSLVFKQMTQNDFDKINQPGSAYKGKSGGGGQGYIDFSATNLGDWFEFLGRNSSTRTQNRPAWLTTIHSLGLGSAQQVELTQRRKTSVNVTSQKKQEESKKGNRIFAWHPKYGFPNNFNPKRETFVFILKTTDDEFWATWCSEDEIVKRFQGTDVPKQINGKQSGYIKFNSKFLIDTANKDWSFYVDAKEARNQVKTDDDVEEDLLNQDISPKLDEFIAKVQPEVKERILKIRQRNKQIVKNLKKLYKGYCQISGTLLTFQKKNGEWYSEVHHLIALGENGSDSYENTIVVSPLIHRMLHHAKVSTIDLSKIKDNKLKIKINDKDYEIEWHPDHFRTVEKSLKD